MAHPEDDLDLYCQKIDSQLRRKFKTQETRAIQQIDEVETLLKIHPKVYAYELRQIQRMRSYVHQYKFMPESYFRMLNLWANYFNAKYRE